MKAEFTPGPWRTCQSTEYLHAIRGPNGRVVADVGYSGSLDGDEENARLIAAAPELLAALRKCVAQLEIITGKVHDERCALIDACAAITKATAP